MASATVNRGLDQLGALLSTVTPADAERRTPCSEWTVADLSDHIVNSVAGMATMARGGQPDWSASPHHDDPSSALDEQGRALIEALDAGDGAFPEGMAAAELAVHTYDLTTALGGTTADLDPEVAEVGHAFMSSSMTDDKRGDAFGPQQPAPADADAYQRIAAFAGRAV
ncbi:MAG: TIGR03086 family metal-binding protein [Ilumatobacteraceae bacterium]